MANKLKDIVAPMVEAVTNTELAKRAKDTASMVDYWDQTDTIVKGYKAIKDAGETYLPKFAGELQTDYDTRLKLTKFTNIYRDVLEGLASKPFEEEVTLLGDSVPEQIKSFIEDVDGSGTNLTAFAATTFFNGLNSAIDWIFIDYPNVDSTQIVTLGDQKKAGIRPFWSHVLGRNVLEARVEMINGEETLSYIRIFEPGITSPDRIRIFQLIGTQVNWELWERAENATVKDTYVRINTGILSIDVIPLVPFMTGRRNGKSFEFFPAMQDAADLQISLYQDESGLRFIKTMSAYPMLAANGMKPELEADGKTAKKLAIGPMKVLYGKPDGNGKHGTWSYVEPSSQSMKFLQEDIEKTKEDLRELGRQPLTAQSGNLTVISAAAASNKARSAVGAWTLELKNSLENALDITNKWLSINNYDPEVNVYNEFDNFAENGEDVTALTSARQNRDLSQKTYLAELKRRKILSPEFDYEKEKEELLNEIPTDVDLEEKEDGKGSKTKSNSGAVTPTPARTTTK